jgi:homospermidine synthase
MTSEDKEMLKNIYTAFAMLGYISAGSPTFSIPEKSIDMAEKMMTMLEPEEGGIVKIKKTRKPSVE